jgi:hypothetical protein
MTGIERKPIADAKLIKNTPDKCLLRAVAFSRFLNHGFGHVIVRAEQHRDKDDSPTTGG